MMELGTYTYVSLSGFSLSSVQRGLLVLFAQASNGGSEVANNSANLQDFLADITTGKIAQALLAIFLAYLAIKLSDQFITWLSEKVPLQYRLNIKQSLPFWRAFFIGLTLVTLVRLFLNLTENNILAITGTVAVALGFAFKDYVSSVIAGIIALFETPYQVGDRIKIGDHYGEVVNYGLRGVRILTPDDNIVTIPHNTIWTQAVSNANKGKLEAQVITSFYFAHDVDVQTVDRILRRVAYTSRFTRLKLPITVVIEETPWGIHFRLKCYPMDARDEFSFKTDLLIRAKRAFVSHHLPYPRVPVAFDQDADS
jgi:small-conductance mechanosensitive channel